MSDHDDDQPAKRRSLVLIAGLIAVGAAGVAIAVATGALRLGKSVDSPLPGSWHNSVVSPRC